MSEAEAVARALNGRRTGSGYIAFCPVHKNVKTPALSLSDGLDGKLLVKCHAGCDGADVLAELQRRSIIDKRDAARPERDQAEIERQRREQRKQDAKRLQAAHDLFAEAVPSAGTPVEAYLKSRGLAGVRLNRMANTLRFHPEALHGPSGQRLPAMLAQIRGIDGKALGVHRTFLRPDGTGKADVTPSKMMLGPSSGGAVRFGPDKPMIALAEGIETALSISLASRLTVWACLSTSGLKGLLLPRPPVAEMVVIAADNDDAGLAAAEDTAARLESEGRAVSIIYPPQPGSDFNDLLIGNDA